MVAIDSKINKEALRNEAKYIREVNCINKRIDFNNTWEIGKIWTDDASLALSQYIENITIWTSIPLNKNAIAFFSSNPTIDKTFSLFLDSFDAIPYHPDFAFDIIWRAFEVSLSGYGNKHWRPCPEGTHVLISKAANDIIDSLAIQDSSLHSVIQDYLCHIPLPLLRFMFARMYYKRELGVNQQLTLIQSRCKDVLGEIYELIEQKYDINTCSIVSPEDNRNAALLLGKIMSGETVVLGSPQKTFKGLSLKQRIDLFINGILYTSRCERFHGDVPSPFKNSLNTSLSRYQSYYYMAAMTTIFYYCILYKEASFSDIEIFSLNNIAVSFGNIRENISSMHKY